MKWRRFVILSIRRSLRSPAHRRIRACWLTTLICINVSLTRTSHAALYHFTIEGTITYSIFPQAAVVGEPFTVEYTADSQDLSSSPTAGYYAASSAHVKLARLTFDVGGNPSHVTVGLGGGVATDRVEYNTWPVVQPYYVSVYFLLPPGTLKSDELPLALPLTSAIFGRLAVNPGGSLEDAWRGDVDSYSSFEVPEPAAVLGIVLVMSLSQRPGAARSARPICSATYNRRR